MDIARPELAKKRRVRRTAYAVAAIAVIALITVGLSRLEPAAPTVERETIWVEAVRRGDMDRSVRGPGTLVPEEIRWVSSLVEGRVERIPALPGVEVNPDTVLIELSNPEIEQAALEAESQLRAAEAELDNQRAQLESQVLNQRAAATAVASQAEEAKLQVEANQRLAKDGLIPELTLKLSELRADQLAKQTAIENERVVKSSSAAQAQLAAQRARVQQMRDLYQLRQRQEASLNVRAGLDGVLQQVPVEVGQRVAPGTNLARVARPDKLKAELRIPETQAKDVQVGLKASIDTRNGVVPGRVIRIDPAVQQGTVTVDVALEGPLPRGARPDLSVDGTIEIERLTNVLFVGRPAYGQAESKVEIFKLVDDGKRAVRVPVQLGRSSVSTMEIVSGLQEGDQVILSDTSNWDGHETLKLD